MPSVFFGHPAEHYDTIDSTNRRAAAWAAEGAPEGALVSSEHQTAGRGRLGRAWVDEPGASLLLSLVLRPTLPAERLGLLPLAAGVAVAEAIEPLVAPHAVRLKWPNDVLLDGRKVAGILAEARLAAEPPFVVLGVGLNVNQKALPPAVAPAATSLRRATGTPHDREAVRARLLERLAARYEALVDEHAVALRADYTARLAGVGEPVSVVVADGERLTGTLLGIDTDGALSLDTPSGPRAFHAGDVSLRG